MHFSLYFYASIQRCWCCVLVLWYVYTVMCVNPLVCIQKEDVCTHQVGLGVGGSLVDLPETEVALSVSDTTLQETHHKNRCLQLARPNTRWGHVSVCTHVCVHVRTCTLVYISAVKRLQYLIVINGINFIVNSRLIAINHTFLSILNVSWFLFVLLFLSNCNALINMEKWIFLQMFISGLRTLTGAQKVLQQRWYLIP